LDAIPYIIAEIPTNPRVEVPDLDKLQQALSKERHTPSGEVAVAPVFILDQTFCPNVRFLREDDILADVATIAFVSGSKFPSGGKCTAGYCVGNKMTQILMQKTEPHLKLCDNAATSLQISILAQQMPCFTPSVFSLDLPTQGATEQERESYKRALNHKLIKMMITEIPTESKYCVSYGQLLGCYWTIPATSTQGTTKESDKDYIARVAVSPTLNLERHKQVFKIFVDSIDSECHGFNEGESVGATG